MRVSCHYEKKPTFIEAAFAADANKATISPRIILSTLAAGDLRFKSDATNSLRHQFLGQLGLHEERLLALELVHSRRVLLVKNRLDALNLQIRAKSIGGADGILTTDPAYIPCVTVADCMPIWLSVRGTTILGVLHSGWKGTGILATAVNLLQTELGISPQHVCAVLGPAIGRCCYSVDEARARSFADEFGEKSVTKTEDQFYLDLRTANEGIAESLGLGSLESLDICTYCDTSLGSSRRQGQHAFTRMMAMCGYF